MAGRPLRRLRNALLQNPLVGDPVHPFADWVPPRRRYEGQEEGPHPAFRSPEKGIVVVWDAYDYDGEPQSYEPHELAVSSGGTFYFTGLWGGEREDGRSIPYMTEIPAGATQQEVIGHVLRALDEYPYAKTMPPALFHGIAKQARDKYGEIHMGWGVAPESWLRLRNRSR